MVIRENEVSNQAQKNTFNLDTCEMEVQSYYHWKPSDFIHYLLYNAYLVCLLECNICLRTSIHSYIRSFIGEHLGQLLCQTIIVQPFCRSYNWQNHLLCVVLCVNLKMTNAFILCDLVWKVQKSHAANTEGSFKSTILHCYL